jgi:dTDP-4-amino-4,6-dideoxygalactose transaminase
MSGHKRVASDLALLGGTPQFSSPLPVGQLYFPSWDRYESAMRQVFARGWYTNFGPLEAELEARLATFFEVSNVVTVTNATVGLVMALRALDLHGSVVVPGFTFIASAQAVTWNGLDVRFCDVDPVTHQVTPDTLEPALDESVSAVLAVNLWGGACGPTAVEDFCRQRGLRLVFDSAHGSGARVGDKALGGYGDLEVFSFHATKVIGATEGGCICTDDDDLAARLRSMRGSYGPGARAAVPITGNGRMSEAQAAIALMNLDDFADHRQHNEEILAIYRDGAARIPGVRIVEPSGVSSSNFQCAVLEVDPGQFGLGRDDLLRALHAEGVVARRYFHPGVHRTVPYTAGAGLAATDLPTTDMLCEKLVHLPIGALVDSQTCEEIVELLAAIGRYSSALSSPLAA